MHTLGHLLISRFILTQNESWIVTLTWGTNSWATCIVDRFKRLLSEFLWQVHFKSLCSCFANNWYVTSRSIYKFFVILPTQVRKLFVACLGLCYLSKIQYCGAWNCLHLGQSIGDDNFVTSYMFYVGCEFADVYITTVEYTLAIRCCYLIWWKLMLEDYRWWKWRR